MPTITPAGHLAGQPRSHATTPWGQTFLHVLRAGRDIGVPEHELPAELASEVPELLEEGILERIIGAGGAPLLRAVLSSRRVAGQGGGGQGV